MFAQFKRKSKKPIVSKKNEIVDLKTHKAVFNENFQLVATLYKKP